MTYLKNHQVLSSRNLHETRALLADLNCIDAIDVIGRQGEVDVSVHTVSFADLNFIHASFGDVRLQIQTPESETNSLFMLVLTGGAGTVNHRGQDHEITRDKGLMRDMRKPLLACEEKFASLGVQLPVGLLQQHCRTLIDDATSIFDLEFDTGLDFSTASGGHVRDTLHYITHVLDNPLHHVNNSIILNGLRDLLLTNVLMLLPNSCSDLLHRTPKSAAVPHYVKRARDYIHAHAAISITLEDLVSHAGCSYRTLQMAFNASYGMSPMAYVKSVRMGHAHTDLLAAERGVTVSDIAFKWGFIHLGRFARSYARQFGVLPSETLRQHR
ncbi:helix-turn-helix transcriptional regulator [Thalassospira mesophila]|uniref:helix-turn-helix transcriptional regulator n=1 Tax=Thalassospira mesophila TaxID=1293891 RepID=UPI000A1E8819|nr:AraC family transcriptional regulator [Thalassospira mesophila]